MKNMMHIGQYGLRWQRGEGGRDTALPGKSRPFFVPKESGVAVRPAKGQTPNVGLSFRPTLGSDPTSVPPASHPLAGSPVRRFAAPWHGKNQMAPGPPFGPPGAILLPYATNLFTTS